MQLEQAEGQMARDQALLSNAKLDLARYRTLLAQDAIPKQQLDTQISAVAQYEGAIKQDQAAIDNAKLNLTYANVTAPISGRVGLRQVDPGNIVHASDQNGLVVIAQMQPIAALFTIPEDALPSVLAGLRRGRQLVADAYNRDKSRKLSTGHLLTVDNQIDPQTGTARLKAVFDNRDLVTLSRSVRKHPVAGRHSSQSGHHPRCFRPARSAGDIRLRNQARQHSRSKTDCRWHHGREPNLDSQRPQEPENPSSLTAPTSCSLAVRFECVSPVPDQTVQIVPEAHRTSLQIPGQHTARVPAHEPVTPFHPAAGRNLPADDRRRAGRIRRLSSAACLGIAAGRLPNDSGSDVLPRRRSRGYGHSRNIAARTAVRAGSRPDPDDVDQFLRIVGHHTSVRARTQHRCRRAGGAGGDQCSHQLSAKDLPTPPVYSKTNPADAPILTLALTSKTLPLPQVEELADTRLAQKISQLPGVGLVSISGGQRPAVRVQANPTALAAYGMSLEDLRLALGQANVNQAKGNFDGPQQAWTIGANDQLLSADQYAPIIIAYRNGSPVRISDVATVIDSAENIRQAAWVNTTPAVIVNIQRQPGTNIIGVVNSIEALLPQLKASLPPAVQVSVVSDRTTTIERPFSDVEFELVLTIGLVVAVIFVFLRICRQRSSPESPSPCPSSAPSASCTCSGTASTTCR